MRKPFQGVFNIIRFNWHFYGIAFALLLLILYTAERLSEPFSLYLYAISVIIAGTTFISLLASFYVYDLSGLYDFKWIDTLNVRKNPKIVNINAGFDETSELLKRKLIDVELVVLDFYDPLKHTEVSIKRARKAYPPYPNTQQIKTNSLPLADKSIDMVFAILSAHEIRNVKERAYFFKELNRITKPNGEIIIMEHLRDFSNFLAYTIGFFHFHSKVTWLATFSAAGLKLKREIKITPLITTFILEKNGITS